MFITKTFISTSIALALACLSLPSTSSASPLEGLATRSPKVKVYHTCSVSGSAALTFDDGPYKWHDQLVNELNKKGAKGSFFLNGNNYGCIYDYAEQIRDTYNSGHLLGSHTWSHADITQLSRRDLHTELSKVETAFKKILGVKPLYFRPPFGNINTEAREVLAERGYQGAFLWDQDSGDSVGKSISYSDKIYRKTSNTFPTPHLVLNHETYKTTVKDVVPQALPELQRQGYSLVTATECLDLGDDSGSWYEHVGGREERNDSWQC
ncbi:family 4 carbohydrate esterase [Violaceomyces palustris]|uniref:Family 4 carbohydrate esterase n=1 Tax=Violaceomyces palustris TaxID=1673888 RepID=A0ACD0P7P5_9BASI|nr:family 4 carbohydrate esterase [Violaceomyces palustris]